MKTIFLIMVLAILSLHVQSAELKKVYGYIKNDFGQVVSGVKVQTQGKTGFVLSDRKGWYQISVSVTDTVLYFVHPDFKTFTEKLTKTNRHDVVLSFVKENRTELLVRDIEDEAIAAPTQGIRIKGVSRKSAFSQGIVGMQRNWNTENYSTIHENGFKNTRVNPLSTFSIDVDNASYSNVRRYVNQGELPPVDAVKIEEMINYFTYDYALPKGDHPFSVSTELATCPWNTNHYLMHVGLQAKNIDKSKLPPSNLVFLIDVSGSMASPAKLPLLKRAFKMLVNELRPTDKVAIVVYAGAAGTVLESTTGDHKKTIVDALEKLNAGGSTAGGAGLQLAYKIANDNFIKNGNNRIILATDGDFNVGVSSTSEMERLVEKQRDNGVFITVLGFGMGNIKDDKMETIADKGNGNYSYIDNIQEARKVLISEFGGTLFTVAKDVKFQVEFNPKNVKAYRLVGYENRLLNDEDFNNDKKDAGEMGAGHTVTALYEIIPAGADETTAGIDPLKYQNSQPSKGNSGELLTIKLRYKKPAGTKSRLLEIPVKNKLQRTTSNNFKFSAAVASFGMLLRGSEFMGNTTINSILDLAKQAKGTDEEGYRAEFIQLVKTVNDLQFFADN